MGNAKRSKSIIIRLHPEEWEALKSKCTYKSLAPWMRDVCLGERKRREVATIDPELMRQLAAIGNLLNQVTRALNRSDWSLPTRLEILNVLLALEGHLERIALDAR